jgi:hypothetical protein
MYRRVEEMTGQVLMRRCTEEWRKRLDECLCEDVQKSGGNDWTSVYAKMYRRVEEMTGQMLIRRRTEERRK